MRLMEWTVQDIDDYGFVDNRDDSTDTAVDCIAEEARLTVTVPIVLLGLKWYSVMTLFTSSHIPIIVQKLRLDSTSINCFKHFH